MRRLDRAPVSRCNRADFGSYRGSLMRVANVLVSFLVLASVASCTDTTNFVGTWTYNMGSSGQVTCPGQTGTITVGGNEEFREGTDTDLVVISSDGCNLKLDANGDRAD